MGLDDRTRRDIEFAALLHDVGKVAMPKEIVNKPGPLTPGEWAVMRTHTIEGQRMLQRVGGVLQNVGTIVRASHERWDGGGYPDGLAGEQIPLAARIVSCCDAFSAMTTDRPHRSARPLHEALDELHACAGTQFDPDVVASLACASDSHDGQAPMSGLMIVDADGSPLPLDEHPWHVALATRRPCSAMTIGIDDIGGDVRWLSVSSRPLRRPGRSRPHAVVSSFVDVTDRRRQEAEPRALVDRDPLTDLYNRRRFEEDLQRQIERSRRFGEEAVLLVLDLDGFKAVNDAHGHRVGDAVLRSVADLLRSRLRATDVIGRLGGDEFAAVLTRTSRAEGAHVAKVLLGALENEAVHSGESMVAIRASFGLATIDSGVARSDDVLDLADRAMYCAKRGDRATSCPVD
jgi:diguanylate cyclase (GGDEF)-like protein